MDNLRGVRLLGNTIGLLVRDTGSNPAVVHFFLAVELA